MSSLVASSLGTSGSSTFAAVLSASAATAMRFFACRCLALKLPLPFANGSPGAAGFAAGTASLL